MKLRSFLISATLVATTAVVTSQVVSQQDTKKEKAAQPSQEEMMAKWTEFMTPGENHKNLAFKVGTWNGEVKHWAGEGEPEVAACKAEINWIMDGKYLHQKVTGDFGGMPFNGESWEGYDNMKKKYGWVWIDNMGTGFMVAEGSYDPASKTFKYTYDHPDMMTGKYAKGRSVERVISNDKFMSEMYAPGPDGKEVKMMEITYTRAK